MSADHGPSYWEVLFHLDSDARPVTAEELKKSPSVTGVLDALPAPVHDAVLRSLSVGVMRNCEELLKVPAFDRLLDSALALRELKQYADPAKYSPEKEVHKTFTMWKGRVSMKPTIDVHVGGQKVMSFEVEAGLAFELRSAVFLIRAGRVHGLTVGEVLASAKVTLDKRDLYESAKARIFPGFAFASEQGVPIPRG